MYDFKYFECKKRGKLPKECCTLICTKLSRASLMCLVRISVHQSLYIFLFVTLQFVCRHLQCSGNVVGQFTKIFWAYSAKEFGGYFHNLMAHIGNSEIDTSFLLETIYSRCGGGVKMTHRSRNQLAFLRGASYCLVHVVVKI